MTEGGETDREEARARTKQNKTAIHNKVLKPNVILASRQLSAKQGLRTSSLHASKILSLPEEVRRNSRRYQNT